ncbi:MAG: S1/P1 nuclease [Gemmatimonadota bacterium]|nr:S1/P1 nuclease [Gemmatimonadota bacterium]
MIALALTLFLNALAPVALSPFDTVAVPVVWLTEGHSIVCDIAWRELTPESRAGVAALLAADSDFEEFGPSCDWPDMVRGIAEYDRYVTAHYVNVEPGADGVNVARDCGPGLCAVDAIGVFAGRLRDPDTPLDERLVALKYLGHIVGDIHQPLHAGYQSDQGGNQVDVCFPDGRTGSLHWVWDSFLVDARLAAAELGWRDYAGVLHADINEVERRLWSSTDPRDWANESFALVQDEVYDGVGDGCFGEDYAGLHAFTIERRFKQAGLRLGALLNDIFG